MCSVRYITYVFMHRIKKSNGNGKNMKIFHFISISLYSFYLCIKINVRFESSLKEQKKNNTRI